MKPVTALLGVALLAGGCTACGADAGPKSSSDGASRAAATKTPVIRRGLGPSGHEDNDGDYDFYKVTGDYGRAAAEQDERAAMAIASGAFPAYLDKRPPADVDHDHDVHQGVEAFGHTARAIDQRSIMTTVKRYLAAAASGNGARACALLAPSLARTVAPRYGLIARVHGDTCPAIVSKLFKLDHNRLAVAHDTLNFILARTTGSRSVVFLSFQTSSRGQQILMRRERGAWKIGALLYGELPVDGEAR